MSDDQNSSPTDDHAGHRYEPLTPLLEVTDLKTHFVTDRGLVRAVDGVNLTLQRGQTLGVVGESGSGKTMLGRSIMRLLPSAGLVSSGSVRFEGRELTDLGPGDLADLWGRDMAMVFQNPLSSLNPVLRVGQQIAETLRRHARCSRSQAKHRTTELLRAVGIPEPQLKAREYPHQLSGGMCQRVMIAVALSCSPKLLLADEPTTALDVTVQAQILDLLGGARATSEMGMVLITHDLGVAAGRTDEIAVMYAGQIVEHAPTDTLFRSMKMPYTDALFRSIPRLDQPSHIPLAAIPGRPPDLTAPGSGCRFAPRCRFAQPRCREEEPDLVEAAPGHRYRCFYPLSGIETEVATP